LPFAFQRTGAIAHPNFDRFRTDELKKERDKFLPADNFFSSIRSSVDKQADSRKHRKESGDWKGPENC
jgi:hypothetical protein